MKRRTAGRKVDPTAIEGDEYCNSRIHLLI